MNAREFFLIKLYSYINHFPVFKDDDLISICFGKSDVFNVGRGHISLRKLGVREECSTSGSVTD